MTRSAYYEDLKLLARQKRAEFCVNTAAFGLSDVRAIYKDEPFCKSCFLGGMPGRRTRSRRQTYGTDMALVARLCQTVTVAQVAAQLGISKDTVYRCLRLQGCQRRRGRRKKCEGQVVSSAAQDSMDHS